MVKWNFDKIKKQVFYLFSDYFYISITIFKTHINMCKQVNIKLHTSLTFLDTKTTILFKGSICAHCLFIDNGSIHY